MTILRRLCYATLGVAYTHLVFGAIVRISGSGMGCGDNWPKCYGHWFPPFDRPELVIEWTHRLLASLLILTIGTLATATFIKRREPGVAGRGGVLRPVASAVVVVLVTAGFGAVTVFLGNPTWATVVHWTLAMTLLAVVTTAAIRAGALGGATARAERAASATARSAYLAAAMAFAAVVMGGLTAKFPFGSVACQSFPGCGRNAAAPDSAVWVQGIHRTIAILLVLHLIGMAIAGRRRADGAAIKRAALVAATLGVAQIVIAASMVLFHLPAPLRSLHEAVGVGIWLSTFALAYLAHLASRSEPAGGAERATLPPRAPVPAADPRPATANVRASSRSALARGAEVERGRGPADADTTAVIDRADAAPAGQRQTRERHDVVGHSFPTSVVGEVELVDPDTIDASGRTLSADAVGTAALIAAVERANATTTPASLPTAPTADSTAADLSLVAEALEAVESNGRAGDPSTGLSVDRAIEEAAYAGATERPTGGLPDAPSIETTARAVADDIANTLEALHAVAVEYDELLAADESDAGHDELLAADESAAGMDEPLEAVTVELPAVDAVPGVAPLGEATDVPAIEAAAAVAPAAEAAEPPAIAAPGDTMSVAAEVQEQTAAAEVGPEANKLRAHTMAVIVARGADL